MKKVIMSTIILMLVCCGEAEATSKKSMSDKVTEHKDKAGSFGNYTSVVNKPVEMNLDDMPFDKAFSIQHRAKGEGRTFWWRGNQYTTNLAELDEFVTEHASKDEFVLEHTINTEGRLGWVLNNDDPDDTCRSNKLDDCGVCDGPGKATWFRDKDGDGLGTFTEWITSCTYPKTVEIEKFQAESLLEAGGDQGK